MRLNNYLKEMTMDQALAVFNLERGAEPEEIKKRFRELAIANHPDRGGSPEIMRNVNAAYVVLKSIKGGSKKSMEDWRASVEEYVKLGIAVRDRLTADLNTAEFMQHFEKMTGKKFSFEFTNMFPKNERGRYTPHSAGFQVDFKSEDGETIFSFEASANLTDIKYNKGLGWGDDIDFRLYIAAYGFHDSRKVKITKSDWSWSNNHNVLKNPEILFPKMKLTKILGKVGAKEFKKKDMETFLVKKLNAQLDREFARIPLSKADPKFHLLIYRNVFMRTAAWGMNGVYDNFKRIAMGPYFSLPENEATAHWLEDVQEAAYRVESKEDKLSVVMEMAKEKERERKTK